MKSTTQALRRTTQCAKAPFLGHKVPQRAQKGEEMGNTTRLPCSCRSSDVISGQFGWLCGGVFNPLAKAVAHLFVGTLSPRHKLKRPPPLYSALTGFPRCLQAWTACTAINLHSNKVRWYRNPMIPAFIDRRGRRLHEMTADDDMGVHLHGPSLLSETCRYTYFFFLPAARTSLCA